MQLEPLSTKLTADVSDMLRGLAAVRSSLGVYSQNTYRVSNSLKELGDKQDQAKEKAKALGAQLRTLNSTINSVTGVLGKVANGFTAVFAAASEGAKIQAAETFFRNSGKSIEEYRAAVNGMVSDAELMRKANLADSMGISQETFKVLARVAEASALKTGQSFDYMFNSIIVGTARSSRLLLDNLGIIVSVKDANERWAAANNTVVKSMTDVQKKAAFAEEVVRKASGQMEEFARVGKASAFEFSRLDANIANLSDTIKKSLADSIEGVLPTINGLLVDLRALFENKDWGALGLYIGNEIALGIVKMLRQGNPYNALVEGAKKVYSMLNIELPVPDFQGPLDTAVKQLESNREGLKAGITATTQTTTADKQEQAARALDIFKLSLKDGVNDLTDWKVALAAILQDSNFAAGIYSEGAVVAAKSFDALNRAAGSLIKTNIPQSNTSSSKGGGGGKTAAKEVDPFKDLDKYWDQIHRRSQDAADEFRDGVSDGMEDIRNGWANVTSKMSSLADYFKDLHKQLVADMQAQGENLGKAVFSGNAGGVASAVGSMVTPQVKAATTAAASPIMGAAGGAMLGGVAGALVQVLIDLVMSLEPVANLINSVYQALTAVVGLGLKDFLAPLGWVSEALISLGSALGSIVAAVLGMLTPLMNMATPIIGTLIEVISDLLFAVSPLVELFGMALSWPLQLLAPLLSGLALGLKVLADGIGWVMDQINDAIVNFVRAIPGLGDFGTLSSERKAAEGRLAKNTSENTDALDDNTEATKDNTETLRDFAREFRNLPSMVRINQSIYDANKPTPILNTRGTTAVEAGTYNWNSQRFDR